MSKIADNIIKALRVMNDETSFTSSLHSWQDALLEKIDRWLSFVPTLDNKATNVTNISATKSFLYMEKTRAAHQAESIINNLQACRKLIISPESADQSMTALMSSLRKGEIPRVWVRYKIPGRTSIDEFLSDFGDRVREIGRYAASGANTLPSISIGKLMNVYGFLTAFRQETARSLELKLEELVFKCDFNQPETLFFKVSGLKIQGAIYDNGKLLISEKLDYFHLPDVYISWQSRNEPIDRFQIPVFFTRDRDDVVFTCSVPHDANTNALIKRNVALFL
jgi:dynein heavy chain 1